MPYTPKEHTYTTTGGAGHEGEALAQRKVMHGARDEDASGGLASTDRDFGPLAGDEKPHPSEVAPRIGRIEVSPSCRHPKE